MDIKYICFSAFEKKFKKKPKGPLFRNDHQINIYINLQSEYLIKHYAIFYLLTFS